MADNEVPSDEGEIAQLLFDDTFYNPALKVSNVAKERGAVKKLMKFDEFPIYIARPFVETFAEEDSIGKQVAWADMSRELMSSARLLPSYPLKYKDKFPQDATKINRTKFLKKDSQLPIWWFNGNYSKDNCTFKFIVKEIDVSGIQGESVYSQTGDKRYEGNIKLMKELYILHFFKHDNLQHAFFTRSEPKIFRMNIILPRSIPLLTVSTALKVQYHWKKCPSMPYVAVCILRAVAYLHARDIVHGNISIENCSYDSNGNVLLGGLNNIDRCRLEDDMINDIWRVGTAVLDFVLETNDNGIDFPDYLCIEGYDSLDDKFLNIPSQPRNNNAFNRADDRFTCIRRGYIRSLISPDSDLMFFFDRVFRSPKLGSYPTAEYLLKYHHYSAIEQDTFQELQKALLAKCRRRELEAEPFCRDRQVSTLLQGMNPRHVFKSKSKLLEGDIPPSEYQSLIKNPSRCFKKGSKVHVYFTIISEIYDPEPIIYSGKIFVDCENSMFKLFCDLLTVFHDEFAYDPSKDETKFWHLLNSPGQLYFPWDIFRLRAAVHSLLVDAANSGENTKIADGYLNAKRTFVLCNHKEKVSRRVQVEIDCSPDDVVNIE